MKKLLKNHFSIFGNKYFLTSFFISVGLLLISFFINFYAALYATDSASNSVTDIILSNTRVFDVDGIFIYGPIVFWIFMTFVSLFTPQKIPFTIKTISLFVVIRSIFISLTHIGPFPSGLGISTENTISAFSAGGDLFFSGHTGLPFLMALVFWDIFYLRLICIGASVVFAVVVLLGHMHYSIDVLSAFFITYTIHHISEILFKRDKEIFNNEIVQAKN